MLSVFSVASEPDGCRVVLFGAGSSGDLFLQRHPGLSVVQLVDNDPEKWGCFLNGKEIVSPNSILKMEFDVVIICSMYTMEIFKQLTEVLGVPQHKIRAMGSKSSLRLFDNATLQDSVSGLLFEIMEKVRRANLYAWLDGGTLLGMVRDGSLIPWDDDLDFGTLRECAVGLEELIEEVCTGMRGEAIQLTYLRGEGGRSRRHIRVGFGSGMNPVDIPVDIYTFDQQGEWIRGPEWALVRFKGKASVVLPLREMRIGRGMILVPNDVDQYLHFFYGENWRVPRPDFGFADYPALWAK